MILNYLELTNKIMLSDGFIYLLVKILLNDSEKIQVSKYYRRIDRALYIDVLKRH